MKTGKYWGSAEHRKLIVEEKKEVLQFIKEMTERYLIEPRESLKQIIDDQYEYYKRLLNYPF